MDEAVSVGEIARSNILTVRGVFSGDPHHKSALLQCQPIQVMAITNPATARMNHRAV
jgi:hypothetical protein